MTGRSDHRRLIRDLQKQGFTVTVANGGHLKVYKGDGPFVVMPKTPGEYRGWQNTLRDLRKIGFHPRKKHDKEDRK
jgi:predicted RNA binding protein YcfA (HicA-like mRNA interferase family)